MEAEMQAGKHTQADGFARMIAHVQDVIGSAHSSNAESTHPFSKTTPTRSKRAEELRRNRARTPRMWNETLAFAADG
jgi:hypothetical protein